MLKKSKLTKVLSLVMALALVLSLVPITAMATETQTIDLTDGTVVLAQEKDSLGDILSDVFGGGQNNGDSSAASSDAAGSADVTTGSTEGTEDVTAPADPTTPADPDEGDATDPATPADPAEGDAADPTTPADPGEEEKEEEQVVVEVPAQQPVQEQPASMALEKEVLTVEARDTSGDSFYKILHLDCGRKYFSADSINSIIDKMAENGFNQLQLAFGNSGLRFLLSDMSLGDFSDDVVRAAVEEGNAAQNSSGDPSYLTEIDMNAILNHAEEKGVEIVPLLNMPGHMNALLYLDDGAYRLSGSTTTLNISEAEAYNLGLELLEKYVDYFKGKVEYFSFGADEFGNDV